MASREGPWLARPSPLVAETIERAQRERMYMVQSMGPTAFVVREEGEEEGGALGRKCKVFIGSPRHQCSCMAYLDGPCVHILFVLLKVLRVSPDNPLVWQTSLVESEVGQLIRARQSGQDQAREALVQNRERARHFLRRGARPSTDGGGGGGGSGGGGTAGGRRRGVSAGGDGNTEGVEGDEGGDGDELGGASAVRRDPEAGDVCPICQDDMDPFTPEKKGGHAGPSGGPSGGPSAAGSAGAVRPPSPIPSTASSVYYDRKDYLARIAHCQTGCGNCLHARCLLMMAEHSRGSNVSCPLCREQWSAMAISKVRRSLEAANQRKKDRQAGRAAGGAGGGGGGRRRRKAPSSYPCASCSVPVLAAKRHRCLLCALPKGQGGNGMGGIGGGSTGGEGDGSVDLCNRCFVTGSCPARVRLSLSLISVYSSIFASIQSTCQVCMRFF